MSDKVCVCASCGEEFAEARDVLEETLEGEVELEGGTSTTLEEVEELRLVLESLMNKELLDSLLFLYKELNKEPRESEMYAWFIRNSQYGYSCKFAIGALNRFKKNRLDKLEPLLEAALLGVRKLKHE